MNSDSHPSQPLFLLTPAIWPAMALLQQSEGLGLRWWHWMVLIIGLIFGLMVLILRLAWGDAPPVVEPAERVAGSVADHPAPTPTRAVAAAEAVAEPAPGVAAPVGPPATAATAPTDGQADPPGAKTDIAPPDLIEITDDMDPAEKRQARIANARANAAYKKAIKAANN